MLTNPSDTDALGVRVRASLPGWVEIRAAQSTAGDVVRLQDELGEHAVWSFDTLPARSRKTLQLHLIPREGRPFELAIDWTQLPVASTAEVDVVQPRLSVALTPPSQVWLDQPAPVSAVVTNAGNGTADAVSLFVELHDKQVEQRAIGSLAPGQTKTVAIDLTPTSAGAQPLKCIVAGGGAEDAIAQCTLNVGVKQPALEMELVGESELLMGRPATMHATLRNNGNADAVNVMLQVHLGEAAARPYAVGTLRAGQAKRIDFDVSPEQTGAVPLRAIARGDGGIRADKTHVIDVRAPLLQLSASGPAMRFVGSPATYEVTVRNQGSAPADQVMVAAQLPVGAQAVGNAVSTSPGKLAWIVGALAAGEEKTIRFQCRMISPGEKQLVFAAEADAQPAITAQATTRVEALADIRLTVSEPQGPLPLGEEVQYEIEVVNQGVKAAQDVKSPCSFLPECSRRPPTQTPASLLTGSPFREFRPSRLERAKC